MQSRDHAPRLRSAPSVSNDRTTTPGRTHTIGPTRPVLRRTRRHIAQCDLRIDQFKLEARRREQSGASRLIKALDGGIPVKTDASERTTTHRQFPSSPERAFLTDRRETHRVSASLGGCTTHAPLGCIERIAPAVLGRDFPWNHLRQPRARRRATSPTTTPAPKSAPKSAPMCALMRTPAHSILSRSRTPPGRAQHPRHPQRHSRQDPRSPSPR